MSVAIFVSSVDIDNKLACILILPLRACCSLSAIQSKPTFELAVVMDSRGGKAWHLSLCLRLQNCCI